MTSEIDYLNNFLIEFREFELTHVQKRVNEDINNFERLINDYTPIDSKITDLLENTAPAYNLFEILNITKHETRTHTPYLTHLLSPASNHKQGRLFFDSFMEMLLAEKYFKNEVSNIEVYKEHSFNDGRIDIIIFYKQAGIDKSVVIENKIYHYDEEEQLQKYYYYVLNEKKYLAENIHVVYLKPYKSPPSAYSIEPSLYKALKEKERISELGYHQDIQVWLENLLDKIKAPVVKYTLYQYLKTIKLL